MMKRLLLSVVMLMAGSGAAGADVTSPRPPIEPVLERMLVTYIRPGYAGFNLSVSGLSTATRALCETPSGDRLGAARAAFRAAADSWARIEWLRLGPVMSHNRLERVLFFPDRKGTGRKQVQSAIAQKDASVTDAGSLAGQSVAMQGLGAIEFLLFGSGSDALAHSKASHRCAFAHAAADNLVNLSNEIITGWGPDSTAVPVFLKPGADNPLYRTDTEALNVLLGQMIHGLEAIRDTRIGAFLDTENPDHDRPKSALFWRSEMTLPTIRAGLSGLEALFNASGIEVVAEDQAPKLAAMIRFEFSQAIRTADSLDAPVAELLADPQTREKLAYLAYAIKIIIARLDQEFAQAGGLAVGFSFGDGD
ncbi:imelysin family protein [Hoeflea sp. YIM 152468]|uniref:imelysin family protein n=1 Tax=Hoeflea sp. YIM 152468 TaxID=3031759 RepID=UPI0023DA4575|nr:imelysin family protein [Hoeflea sp. YIM 152468]MDF1609077.1 imelysin family protein [Hoeflea sp. YIM 152468]